MRDRLPNSWVAQICELYALNRALKLLEGQEGTIYIDSKYAHRICILLEKLDRMGLINSKGKELIHGELVES